MRTPATSISRSNGLRPHNNKVTGPFRFAALLLVLTSLKLLTTLPLLAQAPQAVPNAGAGETLLLEVLINGQSTDKIAEFTRRQGQLLARPEELRDLGILVPETLALQLGGLVALSGLSGLTWSIDENKQELNITAVNSRLVPTVLRPGGSSVNKGRRKIESGTGATLNYDAVGSFASGQAGGTASVDFRVFSPWGIVSSDWLGYVGAASGGAGSNTAIRLDSAYTFADVNSLRRYSLGDFITSGVAWTRPVRMEGAQIRSDFSMRPDLITFPMPSISGSAAVPSTVTVLADGNQVASSQVNPGPFEIPQLPVVSGAGTISISVTNALGQQQTITQPFYAAPTMLAPGLETYAVQAGPVRRNWGTASYDYGKIAGATVYRRGLTRNFTMEGSAEGTPGAFMAGGGGLVQIGHLGVINFAAAGSNSSGQAGGQYSLGAQRIGRKFSLGASVIVADRNYRDVASMNGSGIERKQLSAFTSLNIKRFGSVGAAYAELDQDAPPVQISGGIAAAEHSKVFSANYSIQFHHMSLYATGFNNFAGTGSTSQFQIGLLIPFHKRNSINFIGASDGSGQVQVQQPAPLVGDWDYQAYFSGDSTFHEFGQLQYKSPVGLFTAGVDRNAGVTTTRLEANGAFSFVDRSLFPSNYVYDSFAIVDTAPLPHIRVLQENRDVGRTGSSGRLLVPDMRSFELNHVAIVATDIPPDVTIGTVTDEFRPQDRSGVVVRFPIKFSHAALLQLVDEAGVPIPIGSTATLRAVGSVVPVGYDGDAYVEDLRLHNELTVKRPDGRSCTVLFDYRPIPGDIPSIGPLRCVEIKP